jgi:gluconate kinase
VQVTTLVAVTRLPVLWMCGPPGVGKSTVAWELFTRLPGAGYIDIDQLGMFYGAATDGAWFPEPPSDPGRYRLKDRNLSAVVSNFHLAGARCLIVSGILDPVRGLDAGLFAHAALTLCRLRCEPDELRRRLAGRGRMTDRVDEVMDYAAAMDRLDLPGVCLDTTGRDVAGVLDLVRRRIPGWPGRRPATPPPHPGGRVSAGPGRILWLCGPTAVGKSAVGWHLYEQAARAGSRAAFVDLDQIGFRRPVPAGDPGNHRLKAANLAAVWQAFRARGAERLVVVGPVDRPDLVRHYRAALPAADITLVRLHAGPGHLAERVLLRGRGQGPLVAGDELAGQPPAVLRRAADRAAADAKALDDSAIGDLRIDTDGRPVRDIAAEILLRLGWA